MQIYRLNKPIKTISYTLPTAENTLLSVSLNAGTQNFQNKLTLGSSNLIDNGDFKAGSWQSSVQNCSGPNGTDGLGMQVVSQSTVGKALQISTNGTSSACTSSAYVSSFANDTAYVATFKYRVLQGTEAQLCVWNGKTCIANKTFISHDHNWHSASELAVSDQGGQPLSIYLYAQVGNGSVVRYSDIDMRQIENSFIGDYTLTNQTPQNISVATISSIKEDNPTRYESTIKTKGLNMIAFSQSYHPDWKAYIVKTSPHNFLENLAWSLGLWKRYTIPTSQHVVINGFANGWWINSSAIPAGYKSVTGTYHIVLDYSPQSLVNIGLIISGVCFIGASVYLLRSYLPKHHNSKNWKYRAPRI